MSISDARDQARKNVEALNNRLKELEKKLRQYPSLKNAQRLSRFATNTFSSNYYSGTLEDYYLAYAKKHLKVPPPGEFEPNSVLHVLTCFYRSGGHSRVVERWIQSAPRGEKHSVILLDQKNTPELTGDLKSGIKNRSGTLIQLPHKTSITDKAAQLREIAEGYEYIVLHHHTGDPVPLMAFGTGRFTRPVIVFNHAGHRFWIGRNATDLVIDIEENQNEITNRKRGIVNNLIAGLPYEQTKRQDDALPDKAKLRCRLGLPQSVPMVITMATAYKFTPVFEYCFPRMLEKFLEEMTDAVAVIMGVKSGHDKYWRHLEDAFPGRVFMKGELPYPVAVEHLNASDLYLDSYPYSSHTSLLDAVSSGGLPVLSLSLKEVGVMPFIRGSYAIAHTEDELIEKTIELLTNPDRGNRLRDELADNITSRASIAEFQRVVHEAYAKAKSIMKDDSRYRQVSEDISPFDVLSSELAHTISRDTYKTVKVFNRTLIKKQKSVYQRSFSMLGVPVFSRSLCNGRWISTVLGLIKWDCGPENKRRSFDA